MPFSFQYNACKPVNSVVPGIDVSMITKKHGFNYIKFLSHDEELQLQKI